MRGGPPAGGGPRAARAGAAPSSRPGARVRGRSGARVSVGGRARDSGCRHRVVRRGPAPRPRGGAAGGSGALVLRSAGMAGALGMRVSTNGARDALRRVGAARPRRRDARRSARPRAASSGAVAAAPSERRRLREPGLAERLRRACAGRRAARSTSREQRQHARLVAAPAGRRAPALARALDLAAEEVHPRRRRGAPRGRRRSGPRRSGPTCIIRSRLSPPASP